MAAKFSNEQFRYLQSQLRKLYRELAMEYPDVPTTYWNLENSLCAYYKLFRAKRYAGYYLDRQMLEIEEILASKGTQGQEWCNFIDSRFD